MKGSKFRSKVLSLIELIITFKWRVSIFLLILPILILISFLILLEMRQSNLFFIIIFLLNYYIAVFILILIFVRTVRAKEPRSPFYIIKGLNYSFSKDFKEKYSTRETDNLFGKPPDRPLIGAEIGVGKGTHAKTILNHLNIKQLVLVDPWAAYTDSFGNILCDDTQSENRYKETLNKFSNNNKVKIIRDYSVNATKMFDDKYFDFVYLDADHTYEAVKKDLDSWYPKLKKFGVMCGNDYGKPHGLGIIEAVSEFAYKHKVLVTHGHDKQFWFVKV